MHFCDHKDYYNTIIFIQGWNCATTGTPAGAYDDKQTIDIVVFDILTAEVLCRISELKFASITGAFCLEANRVTFHSKGQYYSARFCN